MCRRSIPLPADEKNGYRKILPPIRNNRLPYENVRNEFVIADDIYKDCNPFIYRSILLYRCPGIFSRKQPDLTKMKGEL